MKALSLFFERIAIPILPPVATFAIRESVRRMRRRRRVWEYVPGGWNREIDVETAGWNYRGVLNTLQAKWPAYVECAQGNGPLGMSPYVTEQNITFHNLTMTFGYVLALVTRGRPSISMLDWGGGIGHYYLLSQRLLPYTRIDYHCKDMPTLCECGAALFPEAHFYADESCFNRKYDLVFASGSLQYSCDWERILGEMAKAVSPEGYLFVNRLPTVKQNDSFVHVQRAHGTSYQGWCLNQRVFLQVAENAGLVLVREFITGEMSEIYWAPEQCEYRGYLFQQKMI